jgi:predicted outer membrane protein
MGSTMLIPRTAVLLALVAIASCRAREEPRGLTGEQPAEPIPAEAQMTDAGIVTMAGHANDAASAMAQAAEPRARHDDVRDFARRIRDEHASMRRALDSLARERSIVPEAPLRQDAFFEGLAQRSTALLQTPEGAFDTSYVRAQLAAEGEFLENVTRYAGAATDEELRLLLRSWIPATHARIQAGLGVERALGIR